MRNEKQYIKNNIILKGYRIKVVKDGMQTFNPTEEMILADGWEEYIPPTPTIEEGEPDYSGIPYEELVEMFIRERYSVSDELAILRQRDVKKDEFDAYFAFCEECKARAKEIIGEIATN